MKFDFKGLLSLENRYSKTLVTVLYYVLSAGIVVNLVVDFINGVISIADGNVFTGLISVLFCMPLAVIYFLILRLLCELINAMFDHFS